jgi:2-desacetyl-2-hydroxyethyl bacteriochlorophyllide A dehydrogenase
MRAAVLVKTQQIESQDLPDPVAAKGEVIVKVDGCGVCGTDLHLHHGSIEGAKPPVVLGHEISGRVHKIGPEVEGFEEGEYVAVNPVVGCGECEFCHSGRTNLCPDPTIIGYVRNGGFAQYVAVPATHLHPLDEKVGVKGGILVETLACVINGHDRLDVKAGGCAMILGAGTVGLLWNQLLRRSPITHLVQTEPVKGRRERARKLGADLTIDPHGEDLAGIVRERFPEGIDYIVDASGEPDAVEQAIPFVRKGGTFMIFGVCPRDAEIKINPFEVYEREMKIIASKMPPRTLDRSARLIESGAIDLDTIVTEIMPLDELENALDKFESGREENVKMVIDPWK